jgi:hypothetical protein
MASKYGETHDIFNTHHLETKAKLDSLLAHNDGVEGLLTSGNLNHASVDSKITACDTGAVVVSVLQYYQLGLGPKQNKM